MAETKGNIQNTEAVSVEVDGANDKMEVAPGVQSVTTDVPHAADASSSPGPYTDLDVNRPPVSTNRPDVPIAHSLVAGAGAPTGEPDYKPELGPDQDANASQTTYEASAKASAKADAPEKAK